MDYKAIEHLMKVMNDSDLTELKIEEEGLSIKIKKEKEIISISNTEPKVHHVKEVNPIKEKTSLEEGHIVHSPIVGTFYSSPSPEAESFVKVGEQVKKGDTLCIIEAMKIMNEIESEIDGEVIEVFVKDEEMVEYNQPLFRLKV